jgi:hypothetical protein
VSQTFAFSHSGAVVSAVDRHTVCKWWPHDAARLRAQAAKQAAFRHQLIARATFNVAAPRVHKIEAHEFSMDILVRRLENSVLQQLFGSVSAF